MATVKPTAQLPWNEQGEDRLFRWLSWILVVVFLIAGLIFNALTVPEPERRQLVDISPRLAQLILEKQEVEPKPEPEPVVPEKEEVEPKPEEKAEEKPEPEPEPEPEPQKTDREKARETAQQSGLLAAADELSDLRDSLDLGDLLEQPQQEADREAAEIAVASNVLSTATGSSSGGISTNTLTREVKTSELSRRQVAKVESNIPETKQVTATTTRSGSSGSSKKGSRNPSEVARIFEKNKSAIYNIYNRALRKNPNLTGKVVFEITIAPDGSVTNARIVSSELGDKSLEGKLLLRLKRFKFASADVAEATVTYPIDFLPS